MEQTPFPRPRYAEAGRRLQSGLVVEELLQVLRVGLAVVGVWAGRLFCKFWPFVSSLPPQRPACEENGGTTI